MKSKRNKTVFQAGHMFDQSKMLLFQTSWGWFVPIDVPNKGKVLMCMVGGGKVAGGRGFPKQAGKERKRARRTQNLMGRHLFHCDCCIPLATEPLVSDGVGSGAGGEGPGQACVEHTVDGLLLC